MHVRSAFALVAVTLAAPAFAAEQAPQEKTAAATEVATQLAALPRLAPLLRDAQGANDASGGGTILMSALYGGLAGAVIGGGVGLLEGANYGRDIAVGAGAGIIVGAALGAARVFGDSRAVARDGLNTTERYPIMTASTFGMSGRF
ncbi:MAG TPA: hypothetical protein VF400_15985 [Anaeromyxobacteraceae bacterium]